MELVFYPVSILMTITAFFWKKKGSSFFALAGNSVFTISLLHCIFDTAQRASSGDFAGIIDIYPTMRWYCLAMFVLITVLNTAFLIKKHNTE